MKVPTPRKLPSGSWFINLRLNGQNTPITCDTKQECINTAQLIKAEYKAGKRTITAKTDLTLREACERYITRKEKQKKSPETIRGYDVIIRNRFQSAMDKKVSSIKNWQQLYDEDAKHLSAKSMMNTWSFIKSACRSECGIELPHIETIEKKNTEHLFLDPDQIKIFVAATSGHTYQIAILLHLLSCRASEVRGLTWDKVDMNKKVIHIQGAMVRDRNNQLIAKDENKTDASERYIPIFIPELYAALKAVPEEERTGYVVKARANTIYKAINKLCHDNGLPKIGTHGLRHSFTSLCYSLNVPPKIVMQLGGWSDYNTVIKIYTHLAKKDIDKYTDEISNFFK